MVFDPNNLLTDKRIIPLTDGYNLEVEMSKMFIRRLMVQFNLKNENELTDDMIKEYVYKETTAVVENDEKTK